MVSSAPSTNRYVAPSPPVVWSAAESVVHYVAPVGQKQEYAERARAVVQQYLPEHERVANLAG